MPFVGKNKLSLRLQIYEIMLKLAFPCLIIIAIAMLFLCIGVIFGHRHTFRSEHIGHSKAMRKRGIHCVQSMDAMERKQANNPLKVKEKSTQ